MDAKFGILGPLEVSVRGEPLPLGGPKQRAILAMLLIEADRVVSLDRIVEQLWGGAGPPSAAPSVHAYISHLRRLLEPEREPGARPSVLITRAPGYALVVTPDRLDAWRFEQAVDRARAALADGAARTAHAELEAGLRMWRGPALAEFASEAFAQAEAARLEALRWAAQELDVEALLAVGDPASAVARAEQLLAADPLRERLWSLLMLGLYREGRQGEALRAYRRAEEILRDELGVDPNPDLRSIHQLILLQSDALDMRPVRTITPVPPPAAPPAPAPAPHDADAFVGRTEQLRAAEEAIADVSAGRTRILVFLGEAGIGKTRLAREAMRGAIEAGFTTLWGACHEGDAAIPFWPWRQILRQLVAGGADSSSGGVQLTEVLPRFADAEQQHVGPPSTQMLARTQLYDDVIHLITDEARVGRLALVLDDLQWADVPSLQLLELLCDRIATVPILLVCLYRDTDVSDQHRLARTLDTLVRAGAVQLPIRGLPTDDVRELITYRTRRTPASSTVATIRERTGGNPFFIGEVLRLLKSEGGGVGDGQGSIATRVPLGVSTVVRRRLARLPDDALPVLTTAAVYGRTFDFEILAKVADREVVLDVLDAGIVTSLIEEHSHADGCFRFAHDLVRETLLERLTAPRREHIHASLAEALAAAAADVGADPIRSQQLASHMWFGATVLGADRALPYVMAGAEAAVGQFAYEEEAEHLRRALTLLRRAHDVPHPDVTEATIQSRLGTALARLEGWASPSAGAAFERAVELSEAADPETRLTSIWGYVLFLNVRAEFERAAGLARSLLEHGEKHGDPLWLGVAHEVAGIVAWHTGRLADAVDNFNRAIAYGDTVDRDRFAGGLQNTRVASRCHLAAAFLELGEVAQAENLVAEARSIAGADPYSVAFATLFDAWIGLYTGDRTRARDRGDDLVSLAAARGLRVWEALGGIARGWGRDDAVEIRAAMDVLAGTGARMLRTILYALHAEASARSGRRDEASDAIARAFAAMEESGERGFASILRRVDDMVRSPASSFS